MNPSTLIESRRLDALALFPPGFRPPESREATAPKIIETLPDGTRREIHAGPIVQKDPEPERRTDLPERTYFCSVVDDAGGAAGKVAYMGELKARTFGLAAEAAWARALKERPSGQLRITSVTEQIDLSETGPISLLMQLSRD